MTAELEDPTPLRERVRADPDLTATERETIIRFAADEDAAHVFTEQAGVIRRLLAHDALEEVTVGMYCDGAVRPVSPPRADVEGEVVRLSGRLPLRYLAIGTVGRNHDQPAAIVSDAVYNGGDADD